LLPSAQHRRIPFAAISALVLGSSCAAALAWTNPSSEDYRNHAGEQLVEYATTELCGENGLPMLLKLWIRNCPELIASQKQTLADLAGRFTTRWNFAIGSVYVTKIGGQDLLPGLRLPKAEVITLAIAGRFIPLRTEASLGGSE